MSDLVKYLFETNAFRVCEENKPFWYTSGKIGPFYINVQFLYGSEQSANELLEYINSILDNKLELPTLVFEKVKNQYNSNKIYKYTIDEMVKYIKENINIEEIDYISGGERRDWFFSNMIANLLNKKHLTIYKDLACVESNSNFDKNDTVNNITGKKVLHIADLINTAKSYERAWIPVIENMGGKILASTVVVDRAEGGDLVFEKYGIKSLALINLDNNFFNKAYEQNIITNLQLQLLNEYRKSPDETMRKFLIEHPEFLEDALKSDEKTVKRAKTCIENDLYGLKNN